MAIIVWCDLSRKSTGNKYEVWAKKWLESQGFFCHRAQTSGVKRGAMWFSNSNDLWGAIDLACLKLGERVLLVQVTSSSVGIGTKTKKLATVPFEPLHCDVQVWQFHPGKGKMYFQIRKMDENFELKDSNRLYLSSEFRNG